MTFHPILNINTSIITITNVNELAWIDKPNKNIELAILEKWINKS